MSIHRDRPIAKLVNRSSLGERDARQLRATVSDARAAALLKRAAAYQSSNTRSKKSGG